MNDNELDVSSWPSWMIFSVSCSTSGTHGLVHGSQGGLFLTHSCYIWKAKGQELFFNNELRIIGSWEETSPKIWAPLILNWNTCESQFLPANTKTTSSIRQTYRKRTQKTIIYLTQKTFPQSLQWWRLSMNLNLIPQPEQMSANSSLTQWLAIRPAKIYARYQLKRLHRMLLTTRNSMNLCIYDTWAAWPVHTYGVGHRPTVDSPPEVTNK